MGDPIQTYDKCSKCGYVGDFFDCPQCTLDDFTKGCAHGRAMIRAALLRLDDNNKGGKWSVEFIIKFLALEEPKP